MKKITAKSNPGRPGFRCTFQDSRSGKISSFGLATQDEQEAQRIANDIVIIFGKPALLNDKKNPGLLAYHYRAVAIVHGEEAASEVFKRQQRPVLDQSDIDTLGARIMAVITLEMESELCPHCVVKLPAIEEQKVKSVDALLTEFESMRYKELQDRFADAENRLKTIEPRIIELEAENGRLRRSKNMDLKATVGEVVQAWKAWYEPDHARTTCRHAFVDVDSFVETLPAGRDCKLRDVNSEHVSTWLDGLTSRGLNSTSRRNARAYLSSFFNRFACKDPYKLFENPVDGARGIEGIERHPEKIIAIRKQEDARAFLTQLKPFPYWRAWAAMAVLCGPRWAEMQWLKLSDVFIDDGYFRISTRDFQGKQIGTKTGRERSVSIERTLAMDIIREHFERRGTERKRRGATPADASHWLFPSLLPEHPFIKRKHSHIGQWSDNSCWRDQWDDVAIELAVTAGAVKLPKTDRYESDDTSAITLAKRKRRNALLSSVSSSPYAYLGYGPAEWRHTFGTIAFMCGKTALEISRAMGNSPDVCEKRYISGVRPGARWTFKW